MDGKHARGYRENEVVFYIRRLQVDWSMQSREATSTRLVGVAFQRQSPYRSVRSAAQPMHLACVHSIFHSQEMSHFFKHV